MKFLKFALPLAVWILLAIVQGQSFSQTETRDMAGVWPEVAPATENKIPATITPFASKAHKKPPGQVDIMHLRRLKLRKLFDAIRLVESKGNNWAIGDKGKARGPYQITHSYWKDAARQGKVNWDFSTYVWDPKYSEQIMLWYWRRYCPDALDAFYLTENAETLIRVHNGGPNGQDKPKTLRYWQNVRAVMISSL